jgi:hypothetical protein
MHLYRRLAALFLVLAVAGCAQATTGQGQAPPAPYSQDNNGYPRDRGGDGGAGGGM